MKDHAATILVIVAVFALGAFAATRLMPGKTTTVTVIREDTTRIRAMRVELENLQGTTEELASRVNQEERASAGWKARAARLQRLVDAMNRPPDPDTTHGGDTSTTMLPIASITKTVIWPGDSSAAPAVDTLMARYDIARDLWLALGVGYQERSFRYTASTSITNTQAAPFPYVTVSLAGITVLLTLIMIFTRSHP